MMLATHAFSPNFLNSLSPSSRSTTTSVSSSSPPTAESPHRVNKIDLALSRRCHRCTIIPPHISDIISQPAAGVEENKEAIVAASRSAGPDFRTLRQSRVHLVQTKYNANRPPLTKVWDANNTEVLPGTLVLSNTRVKVRKVAPEDANTCFTNLKQINDFFFKIYNRTSLDNHNGPLFGTVRYGRKYNNAFWDGERMVFGTGDGRYFGNFVNFLDVTAHELTHAITANTTNLEYENEPGALNEHISDVFGTLMLQYSKNETVEEAEKNGSWLIGNGLLMDPVTGKKYAIRSMSAPGTAYDFAPLGKDPQPAKYSDRYQGTQDSGGVHINSGIPNRAFYLFSKSQGGYAWEVAGRVWYATIATPRLIKPTATMADFANATLQTAKTLYPEDAKLQENLLAAWTAVEVLKSPTPTPAPVEIREAEVALSSGSKPSSSSRSCFGL